MYAMTDRVTGFRNHPWSFTFGEIEMNRFAAGVKNFLVSEDGPTAVEYAVMMALIIVVCIGTITTLGQNADTKFSKVKDALS